MIIKDKTLWKLLDKAGGLVVKVRKITKDISDLEEQRNVQAIAHQKIKEEIIPLVEVYYKQLGEFEDIENIQIVLDADKKQTDELEIKVIDRKAEWERLFKEEKAKRNAPKEKPVDTSAPSVPPKLDGVISSEEKPSKEIPSPFV